MIGEHCRSTPTEQPNFGHICFGIVGAVVISSVVFTSGSARAETVFLDQHNDSHLTGTYSVASDRSQIQTFTSGLIGTLTRLDIGIEKKSRAVEDVQLSLWSTDSSGVPSTQLASQEFGAASVSIGHSFISWNLGSQSFFVSSGTRLAIVANSLASNNPPFLERYEWSHGGQYPGGTATTVINGDVLVQSDDFRFRTYVTAVPEPGTAVLLILGIGVFAPLRSFSPRDSHTDVDECLARDSSAHDSRRWLLPHAQKRHP